MDENNTTPDSKPIIDEPIADQSAPLEPKTPVEPTQTSSSIPAATPQKPNKVFIVTLVVVLLAAIGIGVYFLLNQPKNIPAAEEQNPSNTSSNQDNNQDDDQDSDQSSNETPDEDLPDNTGNSHEATTYTTELRETPIGTLNCYISNSRIDYCIIPSEQVLNAEEGYLYSLVELTETIIYNKSIAEAVDISINETNHKEVNITPHDTPLTTYHNITPESSFTLSFPENIIKLKIVGFGQASGYECLFFITESGNLWYIKYAEFANATPTPQQLTDISDIVAIYDGGANHEGGWHDAYAVRSDKKVYRLNQYISF